MTKIANKIKHFNNVMSQKLVGFCGLNTELIVAIVKTNKELEAFCVKKGWGEK